MQFGIRHCFTPIEIPTDCTLHTSISMECIRQYILVIIGTVFFLFSVVHGVNYIRVY